MKSEHPYEQDSVDTPEATEVVAKPTDSSRLRVAGVGEHVGVFLLYALLTVFYTWPLVAQFTSAIIGSGDARHHLWILWHTREALLGHDGMFYTNLLFFPTGISLLTHALGPVLGFIALPFWGFGPEAANNGTVFVAFAITGYAMYLLARSLGFSISLSFFAGLVLLVAPIHVAALYGHMNKVFLALIPLTMLTALKAVDMRRNRWWAVLTGVFMLLTLLHSAEQFVYAGFGIGIILAVNLLRVSPEQKAQQLKGAVWVTAFVLLFSLPLLFAIQYASSNSGIKVDRNIESLLHQPDVLAFIIPIDFGFAASTFSAFSQEFHRFEGYVFLTWTGIFLLLVAFLKNRRSSLAWLVLSVSSIVFALGPRLSFAGTTKFTEYELPVMLPYALLTGLPGLDYMRTPGRFMLIGYTALGIVMAYGLQALVHKMTRTGRYVVSAAIITVLLLETWPQASRPMESLPSVSPFFEQLAQDENRYGILDLPIRPDSPYEFSNWHIYFSSYYQAFQMTHKKGIAAGYLSRYYDVHPTLGYLISENAPMDTALQTDITIDGQPGNLFINLEYELARHLYRYVVLHNSQPAIPELSEDSAGIIAAQSLIKTVFGERSPIYEDDLVKVYAVEPPEDQQLVPNFLMFDRSDVSALAPSGRRWIITPARFLVTSEAPQLAELVINPAILHKPEEDEYHQQALLTVTSAGSALQISLPIKIDEGIRVPVALVQGSQFITLTLTSNEDLTRTVNMDTSTLNLDTLTITSHGCDVFTESVRQTCEGKELPDTEKVIVAYVSGWQGIESNGEIEWRWAASPSSLWVYSPSTGQLRFTLTPIALHDPGSPDGKGAKGALNITSNGSEMQQLIVEIGIQSVINLKISKGWNEVKLSLDAGNFRPADFDPSTGDYRQLSFALMPIDVMLTH
ncbi:MAG: hypothetical protein KF893_02810 [Caldilineaceae bacterium]|nr:hypothetical protein [Caldilineaceae bacterium]